MISEELYKKCVNDLIKRQKYMDTLTLETVDDLWKEAERRLNKC